MRAKAGLLGGALAAAFLWGVGVCASFAASPQVFLPENPVGDSFVFVEKQCLRCHAIRGYGGDTGPDLGRTELGGGFLGMVGIMWNHAPRMIAEFAREKLPFPTFNTQEMTHLVAFLYALNYLDPVGDERRGEGVFVEKGCRSCHQVGGAGGTIGPPLDKYGRYASPLVVATGLWNKGPAMAESMKRAQIPRPTLSGQDVRDIVAFIRARARKDLSEPSHTFVRPGNPREGAALFQSKGCARCHGFHADEKGTTSRGGDGPFLVEQGFKVSLSTISSRMWNHGPGMWAIWEAKGLPPISFTVKEMADVTAYLYFLQFQSPRGDPAYGASLYVSRGCAACHGPSGGGAPDLRFRGPWPSDMDLAREMWNHAGKMYGKVLEQASEWPRLSEKEVADLLSYLRTIGGTRKKE